MELFLWPFTVTRGCHRYEWVPGPGGVPTLPCGPETPARGQSSGRRGNGWAPRREPDGPLRTPVSFPSDLFQRLQNLSLASPRRACPEAGGTPWQLERAVGMEPSALTKAGSKEEGFGVQSRRVADLGLVPHLRRSNSSLCRNRRSQYLFSSCEKVGVWSGSARAPWGPVTTAGRGAPCWAETPALGL